MLKKKCEPSLVGDNIVVKYPFLSFVHAQYDFICHIEYFSICIASTYNVYIESNIGKELG